MRYFVVSDIHGYYNALRASLAEAGFRENASDQTLVCCGDCFDRGSENREVLDYFSDLSNAIFIRGNHEDFLERYLKRGYLTATDRTNGTDVTVGQLFGECDGVEERERTIGKVRAFLNKQRDYYETERYVFTHGWLPLAFDGFPRIDESWREKGKSEWEIARELEWQQTYAYGMILDDKTIVCGHRPAALASAFDHTRFSDDYEPYYGKGVIALDPYVVRSGKVYVVVLEDNPVE